MKKGATITHVDPDGRIIASVYDPTYEHEPPPLARCVALVVIVLIALALLGMVL